MHDTVQLLAVVALGQAVAYVPESLAWRHQSPDIAYRPVAGPSRSTVFVAWPEAARSRAIAAFVRTATDYASAQGDALLTAL